MVRVGVLGLRDVVFEDELVRVRPLARRATCGPPVGAASVGRKRAREGTRLSPRALEVGRLGSSGASGVGLGRGGAFGAVVSCAAGVAFGALRAQVEVGGGS